MRTDPGSRSTVYRHRVRYFEADQQGVVFNMWYLGYFDEAMTRFLEEGGLPYGRMLEAGFDVQLVRSEIDWRSSLRWPDDVIVEVGLEATGRTSFTLGFTVRRAEPPAGDAPVPGGDEVPGGEAVPKEEAVPGGEAVPKEEAVPGGDVVRTGRGGDAVVTGRTVYVVVSADGSGKRPIPPELAAALGTAGGPGGPGGA